MFAKFDNVLQNVASSMLCTVTQR